MLGTGNVYAIGDPFTVSATPADRTDSIDVLCFI